jgi:hypothetical protein
MSMSALDVLIDRQRELLAALDMRDVEGIEVATSNMAHAVNALRATDMWLDHPTLKETLDYGLRQAEAAQTRVKFMSDWNSQKLEKLADLRSDATAGTYGKPTVLGRYYSK